MKFENTKKVLQSWPLVLTCFVIVCISEKINIITIPVGQANIMFLPLLYAMVLALLCFLIKPIKWIEVESSEYIRCNRHLCFYCKSCRELRCGDHRDCEERICGPAHRTGIRQSGNDPGCTAGCSPAGIQEGSRRYDPFDCKRAECGADCTEIRTGFTGRPGSADDIYGRNSHRDYFHESSRIVSGGIHADSRVCPGHGLRGGIRQYDGGVQCTASGNV